MRFATRLGALGLAGVVAATAVYAGSHASVPPAVKARKAHMQLYAHNLGVLGAMAKGEAEYDADAAGAAASNIAALSKLSQNTYWAAGTSSDDVEGSRALPAIWENIPDVIEKAQALTAAADGAAAEAGNGLEALQASMGPLGKACGGCHEDYQKPKE